MGKTAEKIPVIRFTCECGNMLKAAARQAGRASRCPACGAALVVPGPVLVPADDDFALKPESPEGETPWPIRRGEPASAPAAPPQRPGNSRIVFAGIDDDSLAAASDPQPTQVSKIDRQNRGARLNDTATLAASPTMTEIESPAHDPDAYSLAAQPTTAWIPSVLPEPVPNYVPPAPFQRSPFEVWCDPLTGVKFIFYLSGFLALLTASAAGIYPHVLQAGLSWVSGLFLAVVCAGAMALLLGYGCNFLESVLAYALCGGTRSIQVPDFDPRPAVTAALKWGLGFACGPALLVCLAFRHWIHCGNVTWIDGLIMVELTIPAIGYWMIGLLVLASRPDLVRVSPKQVLKAACRLGWRAPAAGIAATAVGFVHLCVGAGAITLLHSSWLGGLVILWISWFSAWQCSTYALWTLGLWYHRRK